MNKTQILGNKKRNSAREEFFFIKTVNVDDETSFTKTSLIKKVRKCLK